MNLSIQSETILPCYGEHSSLIDSEHGHDLSGDLRIVCNNKLRKLITKAPKYKELSTICWDKVTSSVIYGVNGTVKQFSNKFSIDKLQFFEWKKCNSKPPRISDQ